MAEIFVVVYESPQLGRPNHWNIYYQNVGQPSGPLPPQEAFVANPHFVGHFTPVAFSRFPYNRIDCETSGPLPPQPHTPTNFIGRFAPVSHNLLQSSRQNLAADVTSQVAFETNTHFLGRFSPVSFARLAATWQNQSTDSTAAIVETNQHFIGRFTPQTFFIPPALRSNIAADFTSQVAFETNTNFVARPWPVSFTVLAALRQNIATDTNVQPAQPEAQPHFIGRYKDTNHSLLSNLWQGAAGDSQPINETNTHFVGTFTQPKHTILRSLYGNQAIDITAAIVSETNINVLGKFTQPQFGRLPSTSIDTSISGPLPSQPETNTHFVGRFAQPQFNVYANSRQNQALDVPAAIVPETNTSFLGKFTQVSFSRLPPTVLDTSISGPLPPQPETNTHFLSRYTPVQFDVYANARQNPATDFVIGPPPPPVVISLPGGGHRKPKKPVRPIWDVVKYGDGAAAKPASSVPVPVAKAQPTVIEAKSDIRAVLDGLHREVHILAIQSDLQSLRQATKKPAIPVFREPAPLPAAPAPIVHPERIGTLSVTYHGDTLVAGGVATITGRGSVFEGSDSLHAWAETDDDALTMSLLNQAHEEERKMVHEIVSQIHKAAELRDLLQMIQELE